MPDLMERAIMEINELEPEIVVCSGDLTAYGFKPEYAEAKTYLDRLDCRQLVVVPGNHDSRNVGYIHFEELFGDRNSVVHVNGVSIVAVDSTEPDLDHGHIGRSRYPWIQEQFSANADFRIFVLHHHLLPVPGTGRERNIVYDAGDTLEALQRARQSRTLGPQARPLRLAPGEHLRRQRGHGVDTPPEGKHAALLQPDRDRRQARGRLAEVPVPRPGAHHPVLGGHAGVREVHLPHRG